jgi:hypothetical protein
MENTIVDISIHSPSFKPVSLYLPRISSILKQPKQVFFFNVYKIYLNIFYHNSIYCFYKFYFFFVLTFKNLFFSGTNTRGPVDLIRAISNSNSAIPTTFNLEAVQLLEQERASVAKSAFDKATQEKEKYQQDNENQKNEKSSEPKRKKLKPQKKTTSGKYFKRRERASRIWKAL